MKSSWRTTALCLGLVVAATGYSDEKNRDAREAASPVTAPSPRASRSEQAAAPTSATAIAPHDDAKAAIELLNNPRAQVDRALVKQVIDPSPRRPQPAPPAEMSEYAVREKLRNLSVQFSLEEGVANFQYTNERWDEIEPYLHKLPSLRTVKLHHQITDAQLEMFGRLKQIERIELTHNRLVTDAGLKHLANLKQLRQLELGSLDKATAAGIAHLAGLTGLESVKLFHIPLGDSGTKPIGGWTKLRSLVLDNCELKPGSLAHLAPLKELRELNLADGEFSAADLRALAGFIELEKLDLGSVPLTGSLKYVAGLKNLTHLDVSITQITDDDLRHLAGLTRLSDLDLVGTEITDAGLRHLSGLTDLTHLRLSMTPITDAGLQSLAGLTKLAELHLWETEVRGPGLKHLAGCRDLAVLKFEELPNFTGEGMQHLVGCPKLTELDFTQVGITDAGLAEIQKLRQLRSLLLPRYGQDYGDEFFHPGHADRFSDVGLKHVSELTELETLWFSGHGVTDAGLTHLAGLTKLKTLEMGASPNIKGPGLAHLRQMKQLEELDLTDTQASDESLRHLEGLDALKEISLPLSATPAAVQTLPKLPNLGLINLPEKWPAAAVKAMKEKFPDAIVYALNN